MSLKRLRHLVIVQRFTPRRAASSTLESPSAAANTTLARNASVLRQKFVTLMLPGLPVRLLGESSWAVG